MRLETVSRRLRQARYYAVPTAGGMIGLGRSDSYRAAAEGVIPTERDGKFLLVPKRLWDREVKRLLRGAKSRTRSGKAPLATSVERERAATAQS